MQVDGREAGSISGSGRSLGEGDGNPLQYCCLENPMDRGVWQAAVQRITQSQTRLKRLSTHASSFMRAANCVSSVSSNASTKHAGNQQEIELKVTES